jgi:predicted dehydrogenase
MGESVRIGVIGLGRMGTTYCQILAARRDAALGGVVDIDAGRAATVADEFGTEAFDSIDGLLDSGIDGVIIATSDEAHRAPALAALARDVPVFLEKPLATSIDDALAIVDAVEASSAPLFLGHVCRFDPAYVAVRDAVAAGSLGQLSYAHARRISTPGTLERMAGRVSCAAYIGIHDIDLLHWIHPSPVVRANAVSVKGSMRGVTTDLAIISTLEFASGAVAVVENSWLRPDGPTVDKTASMLIAGDAGMADVTPFVAASTVTSQSGAHLQNQVYLDVNITAGASGGLYADEVTHFLGVIAGDESPRCTAADGLRSVQVIAAIEESLASGGSVAVAHDAMA